MTGKNNSDENNNDTALVAKLFRSLFYRKYGMNEMIKIGKGCKQSNV